MTSKETLEAYLKAWEYRKWEDMFNVTQLTTREKWTSELIKDTYRAIKLEIYRIIKQEHALDGNPVCHDYQVEIIGILPNGQSARRITIARVIKESEPYCTHPNGTWGVNPISTLKLTVPEEIKKELQVVSKK